MAIGSVLIGSASATATGTLDIPVASTVPASDPAAGATLVFIQTFTIDPSVDTATAASDSVTTEGAYGTCFFDDGLNHYAPFGMAGLRDAKSQGGFVAAMQPIWGVIIDPLVGGVDSITVTWPNVEDYIFGYARYFAGVGLAVEGPQDDDITTWLFGTGVVANVADTSEGQSLEWTYPFGGSPVINSPPGTTGPTDWQFKTGGSIGSYLVWGAQTSPTGGSWTWGDAGITTLDEFDVGPIDGGYVSLVYGEKAISVPEIGGDLTGTFSSAPGFEGNAFAMLPGAGPFCPAVPTGTPVFNHIHRAGD